MILARSLACELGVEDTIDMGQFRQGIEIELEHAKTIHRLAPDANLLEFVASVTLDHLDENDQYYIELVKAKL
jgi:hypothetical protein